MLLSNNQWEWAQFSYSLRGDATSSQCVASTRRAGLPRTQTSLSRAQRKAGRRLLSVPFPWSLAAHYQSLASTLPKTKRLRWRLRPGSFPWNKRDPLIQWRERLLGVRDLTESFFAYSQTTDSQKTSLYFWIKRKVITVIFIEGG